MIGLGSLHARSAAARSPIITWQHNISFYIGKLKKLQILLKNNKYIVRWIISFMPKLKFEFLKLDSLQFVANKIFNDAQLTYEEDTD